MDYHQFYYFYNEALPECHFLIGVERGNDEIVENALKNDFPNIILHNRATPVREELNKAKSFSLFLFSLSLLPLLIAMLGYLLNYYFYINDRRREFALLLSMGFSVKDLHLLIIVDIIFAHFTALITALIIDFIYVIYIPISTSFAWSESIEYIHSYYEMALSAYPILYAILLTFLICLVVVFIMYNYLRNFLKNATVESLRYF